MQKTAFIRKIRENLPELKKEYPIKSLGLFGSYVRGEENSRSDLDLLIEFREPISLLQFIALERKLKSITGKKTDLVMKTALKPGIGKNILREVQYI